MQAGWFHKPEFFQAGNEIRGGEFSRWALTIAAGVRGSIGLQHPRLAAHDILLREFARALTGSQAADGRLAAPGTAGYLSSFAMTGIPAGSNIYRRDGDVYREGL
jgi:hypothetical protein